MFYCSRNSIRDKVNTEKFATLSFCIRSTTLVVIECKGHRIKQTFSKPWRVKWEFAYFVRDQIEWVGWNLVLLYLVFVSSQWIDDDWRCVARCGQIWTLLKDIWRHFEKWLELVLFLKDYKLKWMILLHMVIINKDINLCIISSVIILKSILKKLKSTQFPFLLFDWK